MNRNEPNIALVLAHTLCLPLPNPGLVNLPVVALLAYHWNWRYAAIATVLQLFCVYYFFVSPPNTLKPLTLQSTAQLVALAAVTGFVIVIGL
jgi:hypothetical protein